jgi:hypothetical protein
LLTAMIWLVGVKSLLLVHLPITVLAASIGVWLFYVQHQFEDTLWFRDDAWSFTKPRCMAVLTIICQAFYAGSQPISGSITSIIYAAESHATGCLTYCGIIRSLLPLDGSPCFSVCSVYEGLCGTRRGNGSFRLRKRRDLSGNRGDKEAMGSAPVDVVRHEPSCGVEGGFLASPRRDGAVSVRPAGEGSRSGGRPIRGRMDGVLVVGLDIPTAQVV